jgi:hypothetical protein
VALFPACAASDAAGDSAESEFGGGDEVSAPPSDDNQGAGDPEPGVQENDAAFDCTPLLAKTCGDDETDARCAQSPACAAAQLLEEFAPDRCAEAESNDVSFPPCEASPCEVLVERVCGVSESGAPQGPCEDAAGCAPARALLAQSTEADAGIQRQDEAFQTCQFALTDGVYFPPCR